MVQKPLGISEISGISEIAGKSKILGAVLYLLALFMFFCCFIKLRRKNSETYDAHTNVLVLMLTLHLKSPSGSEQPLTHRPS